ncbi:MAG: carbohydrate ABC transporter permease [Candidatus Hadarchaeum sp.]|uniref:carbohydrate ABC transporter permease n=1 Tax=Candidatus Hadarchaeum sp. TaxID=2883567 RepID=UPI00317CA91E
MLLWIKNSVFVTLLAMILEIVVAVPAAYSIARFRFRLRPWLLYSVLATQIIPGPLLAVPLYMLFRWYGLTDSLIGLGIVNAGLVLPQGTWILTGFFQTIPEEIFEAGRVDGCSEFSLFLRLALPVSSPALLTILALCFFTTWNEFLFAYILISSPDKWTGSVGLSTFVGQFITRWQEIMAAATVYSVVPILAYVILRGYIERGLIEGAVKG